MRIRLANEGEPGERDGPSGSLYVVLRRLAAPDFHRQENDILLELPLTLCRRSWARRWRCQAWMARPSSNYSCRHSARRVFRLRGKGVPVLRSNRRGDELVTARVVVPERLDAKQRKLLRRTGRDRWGMESLGKDNRSIFERIMDAVGDVLNEKTDEGRKTS